MTNNFFYFYSGKKEKRESSLLNFRKLQNPSPTSHLLKKKLNPLYLGKMGSETATCLIDRVVTGCHVTKWQNLYFLETWCNGNFVLGALTHKLTWHKFISSIHLLLHKTYKHQTWQNGWGLLLSKSYVLLIMRSRDKKTVKSS